MGIHFLPGERAALYNVLAEDATEIFLRVDRQGYVVHATPGIEALGFTLDAMLIGPHLTELVDKPRREEVADALADVLAGSHERRWIAFRVARGPQRRARYEMRLRPVCDKAGTVRGVIGVVRCIEQARSMEEKIFAAQMTDPLTGLTNRRAFVAMLGHLVTERDEGSLAIFSIDHLKAINMQFGVASGDEVLIAFAEFLRMMMRRDDIISRIGGDKIAVLLPATGPQEAQAACSRVIEALYDIGRALPGPGPATAASPAGITASAGVARIARSLDDTIKRAELALFHARAQGCNRIAMEQRPRSRPALLAA